MSENDRHKRDIGLKMTSNVGIAVFTLIGIAVYLLTFLGIAFQTPKPMASWKLLVGGIGGTLFVGTLIGGVLRFFRFFLMGKKEKGDSYR